MLTRLQITAKGVVQGVGFRPFVYNLATRCDLKGFVLNDTNGLVIEIEGPNEKLDEFITWFKSNVPAPAAIDEIRYARLAPLGYKSFKIQESVCGREKATFISPDIATCPDCLTEILDKENRRFMYPFTNCTNCGPRFTIVKDIPYDRPSTTMKDFKMCPHCKAEYESPDNRRFHAQPNACGRCGPVLKLVDSRQSTVDSGQWTANSNREIIGQTIRLLKNGRIIAIKGIGGFHLGCDATNDAAVKSLRSRKYREDKPFAIMAPDLKTIEEFCYINKCEESLLLSASRPIVLLTKKQPNRISGSVAPNNKFFGVMLPYSPLHHLLLTDSDLILVMTSANICDEPIAHENKEAQERLGEIADYFLMHNRSINTRCDDSVMRIWRDKEYPLRRSRGYAPMPIKLKTDFKRHTLACGAHLKNTFCLAKENSAFISHHIGDLENYQTLKAFEEGIELYKRLFDIRPEIIAHDMHPEYLSTKFAIRLSTIDHRLSTIPIQHHHAHIASCMAENGLLNKRVIGVAFDGLGYGTDAALWGGEFLVVDLSGFKRAAHLKYMPMPSGETTIKQPWRMAVSFLYDAFGKDFLNLGIGFVKDIDKKKWQVLEGMIANKINSPLTSSVGRIFDCVSALLLGRYEVNYEGQAAVELEQMANKTCNESYKLKILEDNGCFVIDPKNLICDLVCDLKGAVPEDMVSAKFHNGISNMIVDACVKIKDAHGLNDVVLSGGVFQNMFLLDKAYNKLTEAGFYVYAHHRVPTNDGGISLGQAVIANNMLKGKD